VTEGGLCSYLQLTATGFMHGLIGSPPTNVPRVDSPDNRYGGSVSSTPEAESLSSGLMRNYATSEMAVMLFGHFLAVAGLLSKSIASIGIAIDGSSSRAAT